jgi:hypothetical protein
MTDQELLDLYESHGRSASALGPILGIPARTARTHVAMAKLRLGTTPMILERLNPEVQNVIEHELELGSVPAEGSRIASAWIKGKHVSVHLVPEKPEAAEPTRPYRIVYIDIETAPNLGYTWAKYEQNVIAFEREWFMLSFAFKWAGEVKPTVYTLPDFVGYDDDKSNDAQLVAKLWAVLDEADLVIAHNGDKFDIKKTNARFLLHGMAPPAPYRTIDTLKVARRHFALTSNKLDDIAKALGLGQKADTGGFQLWLDCMSGDRKAWKKMARYNGNDVDLLEKVYERLRPWHATHPCIEAGACAACGSDHVIRRGVAFSGGKKFQRYQCFECGKWSMSKVSI